MAKAGRSHDLSFLMQNGTSEIGLMLAQSKGVPIYQETEDASLAYQIYSGEPGYANLPPDREIQIGQTDWRAGVGQEFYDKSQPNRYWKSIGCDLRFTGEATAGPEAVTITIPTGIVRAHARFNDNDYIAVDDGLYKLDANYDEYAIFTTTGDFASSHFGDSKNITDLKVFGNYLFIARGTTNKYLYMDTSATPVITTSTLNVEASDWFADYFEVVDNKLWKAILPNSLYSATDATNTGAWTTATTVGATSDNILQLMTESSQLFVRKEDMPYYLDTDGNVHRLLPELITAPGTSGTTGDVWQAKLYIPCGDQGLVEYDSGVTTPRSPAKFCTNLSEYTGKIFAVTHDEEWLFLVTDNGSNIEVIAGRMGTAEVGVDWVWHPIAELALAGCQIAWVSSVGKKRLYIASTASLATVTAYPLPTTYGDVTADANYTFTNGGYFITPWFFANFRADYKAFRKLTLELENADASNYITAYYRIWGQSAWTAMPTVYDSALETKYIPANSGGTNPTSTLIQFMFIFTVA